MIRLIPHRLLVFSRLFIAGLFLLTGCSTPAHRVEKKPREPSERRALLTPAPAPAASEPAQSSEPAPSAAEPQDETGSPQPVPPAPARLELSLEEAVLLTLQQNPDLRVQQLNPVIAGAFELIERGVFDPELFLEYRYAEQSATETNRALPGTRITFEGEEYEAAAGVRQRFSTGTNVEASVRQDRSISTRSPEQQSARVGLTVTQQLLRGLGPTVNLAAIRQARFETVASEYELRGYAEALVADVEITYWNFVLANERIAIFERSRDVARRQLEEIQQRIDVGALSRNEAAAANAEFALREQELINARSFLEEQRLRLLRLISPGPEVWVETSLSATSALETDVIPVDNLEERIALALESRPDLKEARLLMQRDELDVAVTRNGLLPRLELFATLGRSGYADTFTASFERIDGKDYDLLVGARLSHFIGNRTAKGRSQVARATYRQAEQAIRNLRQLIRYDVALAINELERARQQISASAETRRFREEAARAEQERFAVGASTALDVALAQRDLLASEIEEVEARVAYQIARIRLYLAEGTLLERRGLSTPSL